MGLIKFIDSKKNKFINSSFIIKKKFFLSQLKRVSSLKEIILLICINILKKLFSKSYFFFKAELLLNSLHEDFKNNQKYLNNDFSELKHISNLEFDEQTKLLDKYKKIKTFKNDLFLQEKISDLYFSTTGPSKEWFDSKKIESNLSLFTKESCDKKFLGPEWYLYIGHLSLLAYLTIWKKKDFKILEVDNYKSANKRLFEIIKKNIEVSKCSSIDYSCLKIGSPEKFYFLNSNELSCDDFPPKYIIANAFKKNCKSLYENPVKTFTLEKFISPKILENHKIGSSFITLHVRGKNISKENSKSSSGRNAYIGNYKKTIEFLISKGFNVVRIGDYLSWPLPFINGFIDLTQHEYDKEIDLYLLSNAKFHIGTSSGPVNIPPLFGRSVLLTNAVNTELNFRYPNSFLIPKVWRNKKDNVEIPFQKVQKSNLKLIESHTELNNFKLRENTSDEILLSTKDMLKLCSVDEEKQEIEFKEICTRFDSYLKKYNIKVDENNMPLAPSFLNKI